MSTSNNVSCWACAAVYLQRLFPLSFLSPILLIYTAADYVYSRYIVLALFAKTLPTEFILTSASRRDSAGFPGHVYTARRLCIHSVC
jgi:hypothetical protein